ncbi:MAG: DUF1254 domain-containing protein [Luminiphilus sp.]|jgi:hypothetical protein|nr:DUF1254 domain-containing protein [Luminiphilus sp.]
MNLYPFKFEKQTPAAMVMAMTAAWGITAAAEPVTSIEGFFQSYGMTVAAENYPELETSRQLLIAQGRAAVNDFAHGRKLTPTDDQPVVRMNRDTFYSFAVVDVSAGASITIPSVPEGKYVSVQPVTMDHRIQPMSYGSGTFELATHYGSHMYLIVRLDSTLSEAEANAIQDGMTINAGSANPFSAEPVNRESFEAAELALRQKLSELVDTYGADAANGMFTAPTDASRGLYNFDKYTIGAAIGWGGAQLGDNLYESSPNYPAEGCYSATFEDPDNGAFWSFTVYDENGFMFDDVAHTSSDIATQNEDGTYTVNLGCGDEALNNVPISNDTGSFNFVVRHYIPSERVKFDGYRLMPLVQKAD